MLDALCNTFGLHRLRQQLGVTWPITRYVNHSNKLVCVLQHVQDGETG